MRELARNLGKIPGKTLIPLDRKLAIDATLNKSCAQVVRNRFAKQPHCRITAEARRKKLPTDLPFSFLNLHEHAITSKQSLTKQTHQTAGQYIFESFSKYRKLLIFQNTELHDAYDNRYGRHVKFVKIKIYQITI